MAVAAKKERNSCNVSRRGAAGHGISRLHVPAGYKDCIKSSFEHSAAENSQFKEA